MGPGATPRPWGRVSAHPGLPHHDDPTRQPGGPSRSPGLRISVGKRELTAARARRAPWDVLQVRAPRRAAAPTAPQWGDICCLFASTAPPFTTRISRLSLPNPRREPGALDWALSSTVSPRPLPRPRTPPERMRRRTNHRRMQERALGTPSPAPGEARRACGPRSISEAAGGWDSGGGSRAAPRPAAKSAPSLGGASPGPGPCWGARGRPPRE